MPRVTRSQTRNTAQPPPPSTSAPRQTTPQRSASPDPPLPPRNWAKFRDGRQGMATESGRYLVPSDGGNNILVRKDAPPPLQFQQTGNKRKFEGNTYREYQPGGTVPTAKGKVMPDCLHHTEETMRGQRFKPGTEVASRSKLTGQKFGDSDDKNMQVAKKARKEEPQKVDQNAQAEPGEGLAIVRTTPRKDQAYPYHAAPVVAKDGKDYITMEAFAGPQDASRRDMAPQVRLYREGDSNQSFHGVWANSGAFPKKDVVTIPLVKKD